MSVNNSTNRLTRRVNRKSLTKILCSYGIRTCEGSMEVFVRHHVSSLDISCSREDLGNLGKAFVCMFKLNCNGLDNACSETKYPLSPETKDTLHNRSTPLERQLALVLLVLIWHAV